MMNRENLSDLDAELLLLLTAPSPPWERLEQIFNELRSHRVPKELVIKLSQRYLPELSSRSSGKASGVALDCLIYFLAYQVQPDPELDGRLIRFIDAQGAARPLFPQPLQWSAPALLEEDSSASLDSPILNAWVYEDENGTPQELVLCGKGAGWIKEQVDAAILATSLTINPKDTDLALEGIARLTLGQDESGQETLEKLIPLFVAKGLSGAVLADALPKPTPAASSMQKLSTDLRQLEQTTALVQVHRHPIAQRGEFQIALDEKTRQYTEYPSGSLTAQLWHAAEAEKERLVIPVPLPPLALRLPMCLLATPAYRKLHEVYQNDLIRVAVVDALRRLAFYIARLKDYSASLEAFLDKQRREMLPKTVTVTHRVDFETGLMYRMEKPEDVSREEYYGTSVPRMVKLDIEWIGRVLSLLRSIASAIGKPDSSLNRLTSARLFDAAMRNVALSGSKEAQPLFEQWKHQVQSLLWVEWKNLLYAKGLDSEQISTRQIFFNADLDPKNQTLWLRPHVLFDTQTSLTLFDAEYPIPLFYSLYDRLSNQDFRPDFRKAHEHYEVWRNQTIAGEASQDSLEELQLALRLDPDGIAREIIQECQAPLLPEESWHALKDTLYLKTMPILVNARATRLFMQNAPHSATAFLEEANSLMEKAEKTSPLAKLADIPLLLAIMRCHQHGIPDVYEKLRSIQSRGPKDEREREIHRLLYQAQQRDPECVKNSLRRGQVVYSHALSTLEDMSHLDQMERAMLYTLRALALVQVAGVFATNLARLDPKGESPRSIYAKLGPAIEAIWSSEFVDSPEEGLKTLLSLLLGQEV